MRHPPGKRAASDTTPRGYDGTGIAPTGTYDCAPLTTRVGDDHGMPPQFGALEWHKTSWRSRRKPGLSIDTCQYACGATRSARSERLSRRHVVSPPPKRRYLHYATNDNEGDTTGTEHHVNDRGTRSVITVVRRTRSLIVRRDYFTPRTHGTA